MCNAQANGITIAPGMSQDEFDQINGRNGFYKNPSSYIKYGLVQNISKDPSSDGLHAADWDRDAALSNVQADISQWIQDNPERYKLGVEKNRLDALAQAGKPTKQAARSPVGSANPAAGGPTGGAGGQQGAQGDLSGTGAAESFQLGSAALLAQRRKSLLGA